jgi:NAD(P)-dependent dehydrogenase (short-subunit alcohol dehydrogenase family)
MSDSTGGRSDPTTTRLDGKVAFVTGAGGGIGRAVCERFLAEGARVVAADIDVSRLDFMDRFDTDRAVAVQCDVTDGTSVVTAIAHGASVFGGLNVLCNMAGGSTPQDASVTEAPEEEFWRAIRLDLFGTFLCCKHGVPALIDAGGGSVINTTSIVALKAVPGKDCYTAAKGGIISLTRSMAAEYAASNIRVNAVAPGITLSPRILANHDAINPDSLLVQQHILGLVEPVDIANLVVYLASDESQRMTGQVLRIDSGATFV